MWGDNSPNSETGDYQLWAGWLIALVAFVCAAAAWRLIL